jgi:peptidoglycan hydrolase-like protein with peptidoglycan-binding domain
MKKTLILLLTLVLLGISINAQTETSTTTTTASTKKKAFRPTKTQITEAQEKLKTAGKYSGEADGKYNDDFRASLKKYQEENNLEKSGKLDEPTIMKMGIAMTDSQKGIETTSDNSKPKRATFRANKEQIMQAQKMLKTNGSYKGEETGKYDDDLRASIKEFQGSNGLKKSGSLNRATLEKMNITLTETQTAIPVNPNDLASNNSTEEPKKRGPVFRASKEQIMEVQKMLKGNNLYSGEETGKLDDDTRAGIKSWQKANGVKETGTLNKETLEKMGIELTDKQKEM